MAKYGRWIGGGLGWVLGGPIGAVVGFVLGSLFDNVSLVKYDPNQKLNTQAGDFHVSLLVLAAAIMKADGRVVKGELDFVKAFFRSRYSSETTKEYMLVLKELISKEYSIREVCQQIRMNMDHPSRLQLIHFLYGISNADGHVHETELKVIEQAGHYLGINDADLASLKAMYYKDLNSAYLILEITKNATEEEIRKAYRKMAAKYHPDKVSHLGPEVQHEAHEKFRKLQEAYESIKKDRNII